MPQNDLMAELMNRLRMQSALSAMRLQPMSKMPMWAEDQMLGLRPGFDPRSQYDYWNALAGGVRREGMMNGHLMSRVPEVDELSGRPNAMAGLLLKSPQHETFWKTVQGEKNAGYEIYTGRDGRLYSRPKQKRGRR